MLRNRLALPAVIAVLAWASLGRPAAPRAAPNSEPRPWRTSTIDATGDVGRHAAAAFNPSNGQATIYYYDATAKRLKGAVNAPSSQNPCLPAGWSCSSLAFEGLHPSVDFTPDGHIGVATYVPTHQTNAYAGPTPGGGSFFERVDMEPSSAPGTYTGFYNSFKFDANDSPHLAYYRVLPSPAIRYAEFVGSGGNCGGEGNVGRWQCDTIAAAEGNATVFNAVALDFNSAGVPHMAFRNLLGSLSLAYEVGSGGNCGEGAQFHKWQCDVIDGNAKPYAIAMHLRQCSILCGGEGSWIAYRDSASNNVRVARKVASGGNCGAGTNAGLWQCATIEGVGPEPAEAGVAIRYNYAEATPYLAYQDRDDQSNAILKLAYAVASGGNCGGGAWQCQVIDGGQGGANVGAYLSLDIDGDGYGLIAHYDETNRDLKVSRQQRGIYVPLLMR
ncbi:MAG TPA: hypothetical protein VD886_21905 [Herpetosiphonaceae bacterium]|nr:hypothetical protein [Herpetosiphonaceae bacterium]